MSQTKIPGTSIVYSNPQAVPQDSLKFPPGMVTPGYPPNVNGTLAGQTWEQNGPTAFPKPGTFQTGVPEANPVLFNQPPTPLSSGGIKIPNSSVVFKSPA